MKQLILLTAISISLFSCTSSTDNKEKENLAIVRSYKEKRRRIQGVRETFETRYGRLRQLHEEC